MPIHFRRTFRRHHRGSPGFTGIAKGARWSAGERWRAAIWALL